MNNDTALILLLADRQREIEALRAQVSELAALADAAPPSSSPTRGSDQTG